MRPDEWAVLYVSAMPRMAPRYPQAGAWLGIRRWRGLARRVRASYRPVSVGGCTVSGMTTTLVLTMAEVAERLGTDKRTVTGQLSVNGGDIPSRRVGRRIVIPKDAFDAWLGEEEVPVPKVVPIYVDARLMSHEFHLPETIQCACGYVR